MIYLNEKTDNRHEFENLLLRAKEIVTKHLSSHENPRSLTGRPFEDLVYESTEKAALGTMFEGKLVHAENGIFPDLYSGHFGIEVKATEKDRWTSTGNSVLESSRKEDIEKIYLFFGKLGGEPRAIYRRYEDCLNGIAVTHYPRYKINMRLEDGQSIFNKMGVEYDTLRKSEKPIKEIRAYYKTQLKPGQELWWIDDDIEDATVESPIIKNLSSLELEEKQAVMSEIMVYFPEIFSPGSKKYQRVAAYLASKFGVVSANLRDEFSAGGVFTSETNGKTITYPHVVGEMLELTSRIETFLKAQNEQTLSNMWGKKISEYTNPRDAWLREIDSQSELQEESLKISELFKKRTND